MNPYKKDIILGCKIFWRERKSGSLQILFVALSLVAFTLSLLNGLNFAAWESIYQNAARAFGADLIVRSHLPFSSSVETVAQAYQVKSSHVQTLFTMSQAEQSLQLIHLKAVDENYPLLGKVILARQQKEIERNSPPDLGTVWVQASLLQHLDRKVGDTIKVGEQSFVITHTIQQEPDAANSVLLIAPRVIMNILDLPKTEILQQGSRLSYQIWITGKRTSVENFHQWLKMQQDPNWRIDTLQEGQSPIQRIFSYAQAYLGLIVLLVVIMSGLSIQLATRFWVQERVQMISLYKVLGATPAQVLRIFVFGLMCWSLFLCLLFILLGAVTCMVLLTYLQIYYPIIAVKLSFYPILLSLLICMGLVLGFSLPQLWSAKYLLPSLVFRNSKVKHKTTWIFYAITLAFCFSLLYFYVQQVTLTLYVIAGIGWAAFLAFAVLGIALIALSKIRVKQLTVRLSLRYLHKNLADSSFQMVAFTLVLITMIVLYGIRGDFLQQWKAQLPYNTPNYFLINIAPENVPALTALLQENLQQNIQFYPIVRGRLTHINGQPVKSEQEDNSRESIQRPLNLTFGNAIPNDNQVVEGKEWNASLQKQPVISIEASLSNRLKVTLGDTLSFFIDGRTITGTIYQIRTVQWQSFKPNFFVIFPEKVIDHFPAMYITSFYIPPGKRDLLLTIHQTFPEVTIIDIEKIIKEVQTIMDIMIQGIESLIWIIFFFSLLIIGTILMTAKPQRKKNVALLKLLGATRKNIFWSIAFEYLLLGFIAGLVGVLASVWIEYHLAHAIFDINYQIPWFRLVIFWIGSMIFLFVFGSISLKDVINQSPVVLLKS